MSSNRAPPSGSFIQQRGNKDCLIAATATILRVRYEQIAEACGISLNPDGKPDTAFEGIGIVDTIFPLLKLGWLGTPLAAQEHPTLPKEDRAKLPTSNEIKSAILGRKAVLGYIDEDAAVSEHALAWDGNEAIDCSTCEVVPLDGITIFEALILTPEVTKASDPGFQTQVHAQPKPR
jgi:hypothetical protein